MKHRCALVTCFPRKDLRVMNYVLLVRSENACPLSLETSRDDKPKFNMSSCGFQKATKPHSPTPKASCSLKTRYFSLGLFLTVSVMQTEMSAGISNMGNLVLLPILKKCTFIWRMKAPMDRRPDYKSIQTPFFWLIAHSTGLTRLPHFRIVAEYSE